jgi:hypothetical protein
MNLNNQKKYFIHNNQTDNVVAICNEWNIENEKSKLLPGKYKVIGLNVDYNFEIK